MSKKKTETKSNQQFTNSYGFMNTPITAEMQSVIDASKEPTQVDPSIGNRYATMKEDVVRSYDDPFGAATSPDTRHKAQLSRMLTLDRDRDKSMREGYHDASQTGFMKKTAAAALTMPQMVQTGGSSSGTQNTVQSGNFWANAMPIMTSVAGGAAAA